MRVIEAAALAAAILVGAGSSVLAQEEVVPETQRLDVPEAAVALALPADWSFDVEMREREDWGLYDEGLTDEPLAFWNVVYASGGGRPWCDLTWYPAHPLSLAEHATRYEALMTPTTDVERPIEVTAMALPAGEAYRLVIYNEPSDDFTTVYLVGADESRYLLRCVDDQRAEDDWLGMAESLELLEPAPIA